MADTSESSHSERELSEDISTSEEGSTLDLGDIDFGDGSSDSDVETILGRAADAIMAAEDEDEDDTQEDDDDDDEDDSCMSLAFCQTVDTKLTFRLPSIRTRHGNRV